MNKKTVVFSFGRMNPVTKGHEKLVQMLIQTASRMNCDHYLFLSHTQDKKKNPLSWEDKVKMAQQSFPNINISTNSSIRTPFDVLGFLNKMGYEKIIMIVGSDRVDEFRERFNNHLAKFKDEYNVETFLVISAGKRDADSNNIEGISASKAREMVINNNFEGFKNTLPSTLNKTQAKKYFNKIAQAIGVGELV